jgi:sugar-phosphatase
MVFVYPPAGLLAGEAAGAEVVVITATHRHPFETSLPVLAGYEDVQVVVDQDGLRLTVAPA